MLILHLVFAVYMISAAIQAADAAQASVSYLHGDGYASGDDTRNTIRFDTLAVKDWGMVYGRADVSSYDDSNSNIFNRGIGHYGTGLHLAGQIQNQKGISQSSAGIGYGSLGKDTQWFVDLYRVNSSYYGDGSSIFFYGSHLFTDKLKASGFVEWLNSEKEAMLFTQPSLTYKIGDIWAGIEQQRYINKNGIKGLDEVVNQLLIKWEF